MAELFGDNVATGTGFLGAFGADGNSYGPVLGAAAARVGPYEVYTNNHKHDKGIDFLEYKSHVGDFESMDMALHAEFAGFRQHEVLANEPTWEESVARWSNEDPSDVDLGDSRRHL